MRAAKHCLALSGLRLRVGAGCRNPGAWDMLEAEIPGQKLVIKQWVHSAMNPPPALSSRHRCKKKKGKPYWNIRRVKSTERLLFPL